MTFIPHARKAVEVIRWLHEDGFHGLRLMPTTINKTLTMFVGPRMLFSRRDGSYIAPDLRPRALVFPRVYDDNASPYEILGAAFRSRAEEAAPGVGFQDAVDDLFEQWLERSKLVDESYVSWFEKLAFWLRIHPSAVPFRNDVEFGDGVISRVWLSFRDSQTLVDCDPPQSMGAPPAGTAWSSGPWRSKNSDIQVAQSRPSDSPELVWPVRSRSSDDAAVDRRYEESAPGSERDDA